jgi:threonine synthase
MLFKSTSNPNHKVSFKEAFLRGVCPFKGLYIPEKIPQMTKGFWDNIENLSVHQIGYELLSPYLEESLGKEALWKAVKNTYHFPFPVVKLKENLFTMELFHGPTLAFKDVGAQFMAEMHKYLNVGQTNKITVLVATSGDTGGAVANSFKGMDYVEVVILYPKGKVSPIQELQLTTLGENIHACAVDGDFDKCQAMVKKAFSDEDLNHLSLTSANSINVARWMPQMVYYALLYKELKSLNKEITVSVPSGNFGNLAAGLLATSMGLPIKNWIAATNINDTVPRFLNSGVWDEKSTQPTLSNAMDVSVPSNFIRIQELKSLWGTHATLTGDSCTDEETLENIKYLYNHFNYIADPHGAVGFQALKKRVVKNDGTVNVFMETAHPIKFPNVVEYTIKTKIPIPESIQFLFKNEIVFEDIKDYNQLKAYLLK